MFRLILIILVTLMVSSCGTRSVNRTMNATPVSQDSVIVTPYWISAMLDPKANYYKAVADFEAFWKDREPPTEKDGEARDIIGGEEKEKDKAEKSRPVEYVYEYKQFLDWKRRYMNLVKPDGTIMSDQEIQEQVEKERKNR